MTASSSDLSDLLRSLQPVLNDGIYVFASVPLGFDVSAFDPVATVREGEGITVVVEEARALQANLKVSFRAVWITLTVYSDLQSIGLTAAFSTALAQAGISCNVFAGVFHDHIFVAVEDGAKALAVLRNLQSENR